MGLINAMIVMRQSIHKMRPLTQWGRPWGSPSKPQGGLAYKRNKRVVSITTILIPRQQTPSQQECKLPWRKCDERGTNATNTTMSQDAFLMGNSGRLGKFMPQIYRNKRGTITKHAMKALQAKQKNKAVITCMPCIMCATIAGQAAVAIHLAAPASLSQWWQNKCKWQKQKVSFLVKFL